MHYTVRSHGLGCILAPPAFVRRQAATIHQASQQRVASVRFALRAPHSSCWLRTRIETQRMKMFIREIMKLRRSFARFFWAAILATTLDCSAFGQASRSDASSRICFTVVTAHGQAEGAILLNRCSGQSWILIRDHQSLGTENGSGQLEYRWSPIATPDTQVAVNPSTSPKHVYLDPPFKRPKARVLRPISQNNAKCFTFQGRQFCE
jgi:hypothetical protein